VILYNPIDGEVAPRKPSLRPRSCFIMTKLGQPVPDDVARIRRALKRQLARRRIAPIDADSIVTGRDFLVKIWELIVGSPLGIAIVSAELSTATMANIFYEIGVLHALGKETLVIRTPNAPVPSDFVRTEYIEYDARDFSPRFRRFLDRFAEQARHYEAMADSLENPIRVSRSTT